MLWLNKGERELTCALSTLPVAHNYDLDVMFAVKLPSLPVELVVRGAMAILRRR